MKFEPSFIAHMIPFIGRNNAPDTPFVGQNEPLSRKLPSARGFTLVELMIAILIAGILLGIGVPSFKSFVKNNRMVSQVNDLLADISYARSEALKRSRNVHICKTSDPKLASPTCNTNAADPWSTGWLIWADQDNNGLLDSPGELLRISEALKGGNSLTTTNTDIQSEIVFTKLGILAHGGGTLNLCDDRGSSAGRTMALTTAGRPMIGKNPSC